MSKSDQMRTHWDRKIADWDDSAYAGEEAQGVMDRLRKSIDARMQTAVDLLRPHLAGKSVLDLGCGGGRLAIHCVAELGAAQATGMDISPLAIERARKLAEQVGVADRVTFEVGAIGETEIPTRDITVGLGLLDWLDNPQTESLFSAIEGREFLLSFSEQDWSLAEIVHRFYLVYRLRLFGKGVRARHHARREIIGFLKRHGFKRAAFVANREMRFGRIVHNLGNAPEITP